MLIVGVLLAPLDSGLGDEYSQIAGPDSRARQGRFREGFRERSAALFHPYQTWLN